MYTLMPLKFPQNLLGKIVLCLMLMGSFVTHSQTTFTESAASYGLNIGGNKDGGHAWSDFDLDGDLDVLVLENTNTKSYLMRNDGLGNFTNVQAALAPGMLSDPAERQAAWGDINNDGRPDFLITSHGNHSGVVAMQIFIQNASGTFGDGIGGTAPITVGENASATITIARINVEGAGFFDFEGDGDLDIFFDSHEHGIELLRNNYIDHTTHTIVNPPANSFYSHITPGNGSGVTEFGLNQFATDGDYGTAADVDDDGWVDIFMRKRDENDFFLNQGGTFASGADLAQAHNSNKGGNGLWDLDNDGDLDAVWTENGTTQIYRNDGPGVWVALGGGVFPGLPQPPNTENSNSGGSRIDALAGGDIDNDGDIDIILVGNNRSYLYINQLNSPLPAPGTVGSGAAMSFSLDAQQFNSGRNGEGTTMVDIDDDGDLDIYMNISGTSQLYINNLPAANRNNHLIVDVKEDRAPDGSTGGFPGRIALGTNVLIRDCDGNIVSGLRQVNGVFGHGNQQPESVHFGLPLGENQTYLIEVHYPNFYDPDDGITRLIATGVAQPILIPGTNHYTLTTTDAESLENTNAPVANDDIEIVPYGNSVNVQINLFANDYEPDNESFSIESIVQPAVGTVTIVNANTGIVNYSYAAGTPFPGANFSYTITDATAALCPAAGKSDSATVSIYEPCADPNGIDSDGDGINDICDLDDDNDGLLDCTESSDQVNGSFAWSFNNPSGNITMDYTSDAKINSWVLDSTSDIAYNTAIYSTNGSNAHITGMTASNFNEAYENGDYVEVSFTTSDEISRLNLNGIRSGWYQPNLGDSYYSTTLYEEDNSGFWATLEEDVFHTDNNTTYATFQHKNAVPIPLKSNTNYKFRFYTYGQTDDSPQNYSVFDDVTFSISACRVNDTDNDGQNNHLETESDSDGCFDALEGNASISLAQVDSNGAISGGVDTNGVPTAVSGGQADVSSTNSAVTSGSCDDDGDGVTNDTDLCVGYDDTLDFDNDSVPDGCDVDDDNDGIFDLVECEPLPGVVEPQPDALAWGYGNYRVFASGGNNNALGYQESGFQKEAYTRGLTLTTLNGTNDFSFSGATGAGSATTSTGNFANGTMTFTTSYTTNNNAEFRTTTANSFISGNSGHGVYVFPEQGGNAGDQYSVHINFTTSVTAFSFDFVDIVDTVVNGDPVLNYEVYVDGVLVAYIIGPVSDVGDDGTGPLSVFNGGNALQGTVIAGQNTENTFGFVSEIPFASIEIRHNIVSGSIAATARDPHGLDNFSYSTDLPCTNSKNGDSDGDGCTDADEAYGDTNTDSDNNGMYGAGTPAINNNGSVVSAPYTTPIDADANGTYDFLTAGLAPTISTQPQNLDLCVGCSGIIEVITTNADTYQWQIFNGSIWVDLTNSGIHSGVNTANLVITEATSEDNGNQYRVLVSNSLFVCELLTSNTSVLTVNVSTVITNRRITYRIKKN